MQKEVLVICKTHLDIGYTDYASEVVSNYMKHYIPNAIKVGYELKDTDTPFVWSVGSWLIWEALKEGNAELEQAIRDGIIRWHALPFTTHTEMMNEQMMEYALSLSKKLDERFGKKTIAAKMTDVPGHTIAMVPHLARNGVKFLHIGVNSASAIPPVPPVFRWKNGESSVTVMYQGAYGVPEEFDDFVLYFAHTNDNMGPQSAEEIIKIYDEVRKRYPDAKIKAATLEDLAEKVLQLQNIPTIEAEIGDTWIHGLATDPMKISRYRRILRELDGKDIEAEDLTDHLLLVAEHTWGCGIQKYFPIEKDYTHQEMEKYIGTEAYKKMTHSWAEQRAYVEEAEKQLGIVPEYPLKQPDLSAYEPIEIPETDLPLEVSFQLFDHTDYERYVEQYLRITEENREWALWDNTKKGLSDYVGGIYVPHITAAYQGEEDTLYKLEFTQDIVESYGLPYFYLRQKGNEWNLMWFGKKASRLPQAFWVKLKGLDEVWEINKMGQWISPQNIIGSPLIMAVDRGIRNKEVEVQLLDAALIAPYGRKLLHYGERTEKQDLYINLYNNIWNTNFPMWYDDDAMFRFVIRSISKEQK